MTATFAFNERGIEILTPDGFQPFSGVSRTQKKVIELHFDNARITCTPDHRFFKENGTKVTAREMKVGDRIAALTNSGYAVLTNIKDPESTEYVYDVIEVEGGHRYYANGILSSNCEFIVAEETLVDSMKLIELEGADPIMKMGQCRWYKQPQEDMIYVVSLDPCLGTGGDFAAIQVIELPTMIQVAEWQHNTTPIDGQIKMIRDINRYIAESCPRTGSANIYWSVENNTIGEAALITVKNLGEENIPGMFLAEPIRKGHSRKFRKGFSTTHRTKISACSRLKYMIENNKLKVNSKPLISELKAFVASGISFKAKPGFTDDLVSALLLSMRMAAVLADWDPRVFDLMTGRGDSDEDDFEPPMPIFVSGI